VLFAEHLLPATAGNAEPAAVGRVEQDGVADRRRRDAVADGLDPARVLVAEHEREPHAGRLHQSVLGMQVGRAHPGAADAHDDVARPGRLRGRAVDQLQRPVILDELRRSHASAPSR
jgi:hypothetical protein